MDKEYLMLRDELLHLDTVVNNTINFFYVFIASFIAFALTQEDTIFILLSYIVIIPAYLIVISKMQGICKIGAYLSLFHEGRSLTGKQEILSLTRNMLLYSPISCHQTSRLFLSVRLLSSCSCIALNGISFLRFMRNVSCALQLFCFLVVLVLAYKNRNINTKDYIKKMGRHIKKYLEQPLD